MRKWFWLAVISGDKLRWPRWYGPLLAIVLIAVLAAGLIYASIVFKSVSERNDSHHVSTDSSH